MANMTSQGEPSVSLGASIRVGPLEGPAIGARSTSTGEAPNAVTVAHLVAIMTACPRPRAERNIAALNRAMAEFHVETKLRRAAFLAQIAFESAELSWFEELGSGMERDGRVSPAKARGLGNTAPGDGARYKGRGPIPLIGRASYRAAGRAVGLDLEAHPDLAARPGIAFRISGHLWESRGLNALADEGKLRDITRMIGGAESHHDTRLAYYERALSTLEA